VPKISGVLVDVTYAVKPPPHESGKFEAVLGVYLDVMYVGTIYRRKRDPGGYFYRPKGTTTTSKVYATLDELKASLQGK